MSGCPPKRASCLASTTVPDRAQGPLWVRITRAEITNYARLERLISIKGLARAKVACEISYFAGKISTLVYNRFPCRQVQQAHREGRSQVSSAYGSVAGRPMHRAHACRHGKRYSEPF